MEPFVQPEPVRRRDSSLSPVLRHVLLSAGWGLGVGAGVALGAVLTVVSGSGAPGLSGLDFSSDVVVVPLAAGVGVFLVHLAVWMLVDVVRGRSRKVQPKADQAE